MMKVGISFLFVSMMTAQSASGRRASDMSEENDTLLRKGSTRTNTRKSISKTTATATLSSSLPPSKPPQLQQQVIRSIVTEEEEEAKTDFTIGMCLLTLGRYDINDNKQINRTEFQHVLHHVCDGNNYTAIARGRDSNTNATTMSGDTTTPLLVPLTLNETLWDDIFVEAACTCQSFTPTTNSNSSQNDSQKDDNDNCCNPNHVNDNVLYRPGKYSSNYTYSICQYLQEVFLQYDCIRSTEHQTTSDDEDDNNNDNIPTTSPMAYIINTPPTVVPTVLPLLPIPMLRLPTLSTTASTNTSDTKLNSGLLIVLILLSCMISTIVLYMSKNTIWKRVVANKTKHSNDENVVAVESNDDHENDDMDHQNDDEYHEVSSAPQACCWWYPGRLRQRERQQRQQNMDRSNTIAVEAIAKGSVIRKKQHATTSTARRTELDHEHTAYESYNSNDDGEGDEDNHPHYHNKDVNDDINVNHDPYTGTGIQKKRKKKKKDDDNDILVVVVAAAATPVTNSNMENNANTVPPPSTIITTTTMAEHEEGAKLRNLGSNIPSKPYLNLVSLSSSSTIPPPAIHAVQQQQQYSRSNDADTEPYNDLMYAGSNQYFDPATRINHHSTGSNMSLLQQEQIQAILNESDEVEDDDSQDRVIDIYVDDIDDSSSDTSSGDNTSTSADSSKSPTNMDDSMFQNCPHQSLLLHRVDENDHEDSDDIDPDANTISSSTSSSTGRISNTSSMVALLSDPLLPPSLYNYSSNNSSILDHGENVIPTKRPTTITTTSQNTVDEKEEENHANDNSDRYAAATTTGTTPEKGTYIGNTHSYEPQTIVSKSLVSSSSLTPTRLATVVVTPDSNDTEKDGVDYREENDEPDEVDDDINKLLQQYQEKILSKEFLIDSDAASNDAVRHPQLLSGDNMATSGDITSLSTMDYTPKMTTTTRSLGAGNTPIHISPSHEDYNVTLQWNSNPTAATTTTTSTASTTNEVVNDSKSNDLEANHIPLQQQTSEDAVDSMDGYDDATTVVISNQNQASSFLRHIFKSPGKTVATSKSDPSPECTIPKSTSKQTTATPPIQTVITKNKSNVITPSKTRKSADANITTAAIV